MKREISLITLGVLLITVGVLALRQYNASSLPFTEAAKTSAANSSVSLPKNVFIPKSQINAEVAVGGYKDGKWILDIQHAFYFPTSDTLGKGGNTILYAHRRKNLFGNLKKTGIGDFIIITDTKGKVYTYKVYSKEDIKPYELEKVNTHSQDSITLFTCDGWFDQNRLVVKAKIV